MSQDIKQLQKLAKQHDKAAILALAEMYFTGIDVPQDFKKAFDYYFQAAELEDVSAQYKLGQMYASGNAIPHDGKKAIRYYLLAAEQNMPQAQYELASIYHEGRLVKHDFAQAFFWYEKAAAADIPKAQYNLGCLYLQGEGTEKNEAKAEALFLKSASTVPESLRMLGQIYRDRNDIYQSVEWYEKAAKAGDNESLFMLGLFYEMGPDEWRDLNKASELYAEAARSNHQQARGRLEKLAKTDKFARDLLNQLISK